MLCLESLEEMPAAKDEVAEAKEEGIEILNGWGPKEILTENSKEGKTDENYERRKKIVPLLHGRA